MQDIHPHTTGFSYWSFGLHNVPFNITCMTHTYIYIYIYIYVCVCVCQWIILFRISNITILILAVVENINPLKLKR